MTEHEWLGSPDTALMVAYLQGRASDRKLRLLACAYARRAWWRWLTDERSKEAVVVAERYADGLATLQELENAATAAAMPFRRRTPEPPPSIEFDLDGRDAEFSASAPWYA